MSTVLCEKLSTTLLFLLLLVLHDVVAATKPQMVIVRHVHPVMNGEREQQPNYSSTSNIRAAQKRFQRFHHVNVYARRKKVCGLNRF